LIGVFWASKGDDEISLCSEFPTEKSLQPDVYEFGQRWPNERCCVKAISEFSPRYCHNGRQHKTLELAQRRKVAKKMKNPTASSAVSKELYNNFPQSCHPRMFLSGGQSEVRLD